MSASATPHQVERPERERRLLHDARPQPMGPVLWTLAASLNDVTTAKGLPRHLYDELSKMLDGWYGGDLSDVLAVTTKAAVQLLVSTGGPGSLRLVGSSAQLLIELASRNEAPSGSDTRLARPHSQLDAVKAQRGHFHTLGEDNSLHVRWVGIPLPAVQGTTSLPQPKTPKDVWS